MHKSRGELTKRVVNITFLSICFTIILLIWGVNQSELAVFVGSALTILGVALFAQWSILSNITSSIIIFFNHPIKLNDSVALLEGKDYVLEGKVVNIGLFFITLTTDNAEEITLPNNMFIQKTIKKRSADEDGTLTITEKV
jgi:small-conductance mechanosensitive channel